MKAKLIAFPVDDICCRVWCPFCARWHTHGYDGEERRRWTHRVQHCRDKTFFPQGYWIKLAPAKDRLGGSLHAKQVRANPRAPGPLSTNHRSAAGG